MITPNDYTEECVKLAEEKFMNATPQPQTPSPQIGHGQTVYFKVDPYVDIAELRSLADKMAGKDFVILPPGVEILSAGLISQLIDKTLQWGTDRNIIGANREGTVEGQVKKLSEELGEAVFAVGKYIGTFNHEDLIDAKKEIGDILVSTTLLCDMLDLTVEECLEAAYNKIANREGEMVNGIFVRNK